MSTLPPNSSRSRSSTFSVTNDLDLVTLNVLERLLLEFGGSVLIVTHDRYFLDKVATAILAFEGAGKVVRYPGNYEMYRTLKEQAERATQEGSPRSARRGEEARAAGTRSPAAIPEPASDRARRPGKLTYKEQREVDGMEAAILAAEERKSALEATLSDPATYQKTGAGVATLRDDLEQVSAEIERLYARWQVLEAIRGGT